MQIKVPPPIVMVLCASPILIASMFELSPNEVDWVIAGCLMITSLYIAVRATLEFKRHRTTVNPIRFENVTTLVIGGIFQYSRNPMYLSLLLFILALGVLFSAYWIGTLMAGVFGLYTTQFQIKPEELYLREKYGRAYDVYSQSVRRWI
ncbi:methyltransferase family protein [Vibrio agarivorans]|uniref:Isoprenylcysteine carboxylmethyltransferase family protein n=1 Tax=Vibrio agarivorans TaxID=153622 RepID=A0ABT7Y4C3_9VIBR|nr:isoprenylcysteine carboxylmethyltransferase family protein [Vibrio agarivorans]MDN2482887.1 isoprenylcysteine carboxylmethyltransferase family protein [Vibrio agarivorans]